jgi:UDP-N-acetylglucosamine:LPS N-acetylglucosamine transferase
MTKKVLFISGSIGLGHVTRDLAVVKEIRKLIPEVDISWLAAHPASQVLQDAGEKLLPDSDRWRDYTAMAEKTAGSGSLNLIKWLFRSRNDWTRNVEVFKEVLSKYQFDLIIGDETYEISVAVKRNPQIKKIPYVVIYDFIGMKSMSINPMEILGAYLWNKKWVAGADLKPFPIELTIFLGELEDIPDKKFGFLLPNIREFAKARCEFVGYILNMDPDELRDKTDIRKKLGYGDEPLIICTIGGTAIGKDLLDLCARAYPLASEKIPDLKMVLVGGPRIHPESLNVPQGIEAKGYIPNLTEHFAACDLAIVQAGGTTTLELTALKKPFLYFPLERHCEQQFHVAGRLARHKAGVKMSFRNTTPESLAEKIVADIGKEVTYEPIPIDGAHNAADKIKRFLV